MSASTRNAELFEIQTIRMMSTRVVTNTVTACMVLAAICIWRFAEPVHEVPSADSGEVSAITKSSRSFSHRWNFLTKVFGLVLLEVATTAVVAYVVRRLVIHSDPVFGRVESSSEKLAEMLLHPWSLCVSVVCSFTVLVCLMIWRHDPTLGIRFFEALALVQGYWVGLACVRYPWELIVVAGGITASIFTTLAVITLTLTYYGVDFGFLEPLLTQLLLVLIFSSLLRLTTDIQPRVIGCAAFGIVLFSAYIVFDLNRAARRYADDEYIAAALDLYLDVINLFLEILRYLPKSK